MIAEEAEGARPFYRPGDVVTNIYGDKGVIVKAEVIVEGMSFGWREEPTSGRGTKPHYAVEWFANSQGGANCKESKYAWWGAHEWADVELGLVHSKQEKET